MQALGLHAKDDDHVGIFESFFESENAADGHAGAGNFFQFARDPHRRAAQREPAAKFAEQMNVGASDAAVLKVAEDGDIQIFDFAFAVADRQRIEQVLARDVRACRRRR